MSENTPDIPDSEIPDPDVEATERDHEPVIPPEFRRDDDSVLGEEDDSGIDNDDLEDDDEPDPDFDGGEDVDVPEPDEE